MTYLVIKMPRTLFLYLNIAFFKRAGLFTIGLSGILSIFDILANAGDVTRYSDNILPTLGQYMALRFPEILNTVIPLGGLLAILTVMSQKVSNQEMTALRSVGVSIYQIVGMFALGGIIIVILHFLLINLVVPQTSHTLHLWSEMDFRGAPPESRTNEQIPNWIATGNTIIKLEEASSDGRVLKNLSVIIRSKNGIIQDYFTAKKAQYTDNAWHLDGINYPESLAAAVTTQKMVLDLPIRPGFFAKTVDNPLTLSILDLWRIASGDVVFEKPPHVYQVWLHQKFAHPAGILIMIFLAAPIGLQIARNNTLMLSGFCVITAGFLYFIADSLIATLGEGGFIPPVLAAWSPAVIFSLLSAWIIVLQDG